jgi:hypothetical protein
MWFTNVAAPPWLSKSQSVHTMSEPYPPSDVRPFSTLGCTQRRYATIARVSGDLDCDGGDGCVDDGGGDDACMQLAFDYARVLVVTMPMGCESCEYQTMPMGC